MGYKLDLQEADNLRKLLNAVEAVKGNRVITPEVHGVLEAATKLENTKQFLNDNA